jgi:hypothetical protein
MVNTQDTQATSNHFFTPRLSARQRFRTASNPTTTMAGAASHHKGIIENPKKAPGMNSFTMVHAISIIGSGTLYDPDRDCRANGASGVGEPLPPSRKHHPDDPTTGLL